MGVPTGGQLGHASGSITITTTQAQQAPAVMRQVAAGINNAMAGVNTSTNKASASIGGLTRSVRGLAGAFGVGLGAREITKFVTENEKLATAYARQNVAARGLAGSQGRLNELMAAYGKATGGAIDQATALSNVTRLQATGFGDSAQELERFVRAVRGSSIAMGKTQDEISQEVQLAISNRSFKRLDQIGLGIEEVTDRVTELRAANSGLSQDQAFAEAVLGRLEEKYGALTTSIEGQATGLEKLARAWADLRLEMGKAAQGPANTIGSRLAERFDATAEVIRLERARQAANQTGIIPGGLPLQGNRAGAQSVLDNLRAGRERVLDDIATGARPASQTGPLLEELNRKIRAASISIAGLSAMRILATGDMPQGAPDIRGGSSARTPRFSPEQEAVITEWNQARVEIERQAGREIAQETKQYSQQRANAIANYEKGIARDAEDFARSRVYAERKLGLDILDVHQDSARQRVRLEADLARTIADATADSTERIAELREDSAKRLEDLEKNYTKSRERAAGSQTKSLRDAAGRLDAKAVADLQYAYKLEEQAAKEAHDEQRSELEEALQERIQDEEKALAKSIRQQQDAHARQLADQAENDRLRIADMKQAFADQKAQEDEERGIRLGRQAEDHQAQLTALDTAHQDRITQIGIHAADERAKLDEEFKKQLDALDVVIAGWTEQQDRLTENAIKAFDKWLKHVVKELEKTGHPSEADPYTDRPLPSYDKGGYVASDQVAKLHKGEYVVPHASRVALPGGGSIHANMRDWALSMMGLRQSTYTPMLGGSGASGGGASGGGSSRSATFTGDVNVTIAGSTNMDRSEMKAVAREAFIEALEQIAA